MKTVLLFTFLFAAPTLAFAQSDGKTEVPVVRAARMVPSTNPLAFKIKKASWSSEDEAGFGQFVARIGEAVESGKCLTVTACMKSSANPFFSQDPAGVNYHADCADWPYYLRAYYAFHKGLPFSFVIKLVPRDPNDPRLPDLRYTASGNKPAARQDNTSLNNSFPFLGDFFGGINNRALIADGTSTATFRTPVLPAADEPLNDFYPVPVNRSGIKPGTAFYAARGHAGIVYKVGADGSIKIVDAHPDNSLSSTPFEETYEASRQAQGSIFKAFRPLELIGASADAEGNLLGGKIVLKTDDQISMSNYEQVTGKFKSSPARFDWMRRRMAASKIIINVVQDFSEKVDKLCNLAQARVRAVDYALNAGMDNHEAPAVMVPNIFGASGEWEEYSTPGRDVTLRQIFKALRDTLQYNVEQWRAGDQGFSYGGSNIAQDLFSVYQSKAMSCQLNYTSRSGAQKSLNLEELRTRLFKISFDYFQCADLRWGDTAAGQQYCSEDMRWYNAEQYLRNLTQRDLDGRHDMSVDQMEQVNAQKNVPFEWDTNVILYIKSLGQVLGVQLR